MKELYVKTSANTEIAVSVFAPEISNQKLLLINSATGVKQHLYFSFAQYFCSLGFTVITYDYGGIGKSGPADLKGFKSSMRTWGSQDFKAVTGFILLNYPGYTKFCLGHSVGALILGPNQDSKIFHKFIFVATQDAYIGHLRFKIAMLGLFGFGLLMPVITKALGYFPAHWFGLGEPLPAGVAFDWRTLIVHPQSTSRLLEKATEDHSKSLSQKAVVIHAEDDDWVTMKGMESLMNNAYPNLKKSYRELKVSASEKGEIGHVNFFRTYNKNLWKVVSDEL
ncbi:hypothetical protein FIC_02270 [Flavobacteriaceae bacterium 3519-10]|nr:hypothetical protein FIC_02270 [Flavobacteriaceae bacterium 3519-10]